MHKSLQQQRITLFELNKGEARISSMQRTIHLSAVALVLAFVLGLFVVAGPVGATTTYFSLLPADKASQGCNACHNGAPTKQTLNDLGKKVAAAAPKTKEEMAKLLTAASPTNTLPSTKSSGAAANKINVVVSGKPASVDGVVTKGRTLVALRAISELLGATVNWNNTEKRATVTKGSTRVEITVGKAVARVNGKDTRLDVPAQLTKGMVMVPLRFLAESLGATVNYGQQGIIISTSAAAPTQSSAAKGINQLIDKSQALAGYVGTQTCKACHSDKYNAWLTTGHSRHVRDVSQPGATNANFAAAPSIDASNLLFAIGGLTKQYFVDKDYKLIGWGWDQEKKVWVENPALAGADYIERCAACHTVGFNKDTKKAVDLNIGCESCHGPGAQHVASGGDKSKIQVSVSDDVCGKCHGDQQAQLESMGEKWARDGVPRDGHSNHFKNLLESNPNYSDNCTKCHSATVFLALAKGEKPPTLEDFKNGAYKNDRNGITCVVCHNPHERTQESQLRKSPQETCTQCHTADKALTAGQKMSHSQKEFFEGKGIGVDVPAPKSAQCIDCHMADGNHYFKPGTPTVTLESKGKPYEANPCAKCHSTLTTEEIEAKQAAVKTKYEALNKALTEAKAKLEAAQKANKDVTAAKQLYDASFTNLSLISGDGSQGIHNYPFAQALLAKVEADLAEFNKLLP